MPPESDQLPPPQLEYQSPRHTPARRWRARTVIAASALFGVLTAAAYFALAVPGPPYYLEPVSGFIANILTLPALLFQELYPNDWTIKYNSAALIITNGVLFALFGALLVAIRRVPLFPQPWQDA
jgi:hypothetical protein